MKVFLCWLLALSSILFLGVGLMAAKTDAPTPSYLGSKICASCHATITKAWKDSHHAWAWKKPHGQSVLGNFADKVFKHKGGVSRFTKSGNKFFVETDGADGRSQKFEVVGTVGVEPLQQYLVETEPGRVQALDLAWDTQKLMWYDLYPEQNLPPTSGLHWTGPYKNWNARCAVCHATGFEKHYVPRTRRYSSKQAEIGVGCEACHGPGGAHVAWARNQKTFDPTAWKGVNAHGFTISFDRKNAETEIQHCAGCHSRREAFGDASPIPGTPFHDSYRLALLRDGLYHPGGQIRDEVYVYGSFLQSKMYQRGVRCTDCHEPHTATLRAKGNAVCTQCHNTSGNPDFPSLKKADYDTPAHHFHKSGSDGAQCKSCHMIERTYMGNDGRRDHSFRVPRPDLSVVLGTPNACTDCHKDKSAGWAAGEVAKRFPNSSNRGMHYAETFAAARQGKGGTKTANGLLDIALTGTNAGIVRATALDLLRRYATAEIADRAGRLLRDPDPIVRAAAVALQRAAPPNLRIQRVTPLLQDRRRAVRIAAARAILDLLANRRLSKLDRAGQGAVAEYQRSLAAKADFPEMQMAIAGTALVFRNLPVAERAFQEATAMDPQLVQAWIMIARLRAARGDVQGAVKALLDGVAANPNDENLAKALQDLGGLKRAK